MRAEIVELGADRSGQRLLPNRFQIRIALNLKRFGTASRSSCIASWDVKNLGHFEVLLLQPLPCLTKGSQMLAATFEFKSSEPQRRNSV